MNDFDWEDLAGVLADYIIMMSLFETGLGAIDKALQEKTLSIIEFIRIARREKVKK